MVISSMESCKAFAEGIAVKLWRRSIALSVAIGIVPCALMLTGCSGKSGKTADPAEIEKHRQEHIKLQQREMHEGK